ncbi:MULTISPECIES: hypothetical protein [unclassified Inquilinus]|uniref:hypothetical protein n=1 Tax=unclassified Inquilinus TaxID=2645927 RepID=UPI003F90517F
MTELLMLRIAFIVAMIFAAPTAAVAGAISFHCVFNQRWSPKGMEADDFRFDVSYDTLTNKAFMTGNAGVQELFVYRSNQAITFIEPLATGAAQMTTIVLDGSALHSRHSLIGGEFSPSQYSGRCSFTN